MKSVKTVSIFLAMVVLAVATACSSKTKAPDVTDDIRHSLDQAGLSDVRVSQDRDKNVVTLSGTVHNDSDKTRAESIARSAAGNQVVANEVAVEPTGDESDAKKVNSDVDKGIDKNLEAMLVEHKMDRGVRHDVKNGVVTLKGTVTSQSKRTSVEKVAAQVPNVKQVVNELEVKNQKATSTESR